MIVNLIEVCEIFDKRVVVLSIDLSALGGAAREMGILVKVFPFQARSLHSSPKNAARHPKPPIPAGDHPGRRQCC